MGEACRDRDVWFLVDACQSVGQMPVEPDALGADFVSATARKFLRGPRGAGFLWVSNRVLDAELEPRPPRSLRERLEGRPLPIALADPVPYLVEPASLGERHVLRVNLVEPGVVVG